MMPRLHASEHRSAIESQCDQWISFNDAEAARLGTREEHKEAYDTFVEQLQ